MIDGAKACPLEDIGGVGGYHVFLNVLSGTITEDDDEYVFYGDELEYFEFDPDFFDLKAARKRVREMHLSDLKMPGHGFRNN